MPSQRASTARQEVSYQLPELAEKFIAQLAAAARSPLTLAMYRRVIADLTDFARVEDIRLINKETIACYTDHVLRKKLGLKAKHYWLAQMKIFFRWVADQGLVLADPTAQIKLPATKKRKYPPYLAQQEVARLLDSIPTERPEDLHDRALCELLYSCGLRTGEVIRLTLDHINFEEQTVTILMSKCKKDRMIPVGKTALHYLDRYIKEVRGLCSGPLFYHTPTGGPLKGWQLHRQIIMPAAKRAHIKKRCSVKTFRHSFAIHMLENGASIRHIQEMLGHSDLCTTQKYTNVVPEELKRAHLAAHPAEHRGGRFPKAHPKHLHMSYPRSERKTG